MFFPLLVYLNMNGVKSELPTITAVTAFFVVAYRSHHGYVLPAGVLAGVSMVKLE